MEDFIYFNTCESERDLNDYIGRYNIFMLNKDGRSEFVYGDRKVFYSLEGSLVVWPKSKPCDYIDYPEQTSLRQTSAPKTQTLRLPKKRRGPIRNGGGQSKSAIGQTTPKRRSARYSLFPR